MWLQFQSSRSLRTATADVRRRAVAVLDFNPRGPCGPRRSEHHQDYGFRHISILAVLADRDWKLVGGAFKNADFNPRGPCGPRLPPPKRDRLPPHYFNPRGPCGPRPANWARRWPWRISILAVLADRDAHWVRPSATLTAFQSSRSLRTATRRSTGKRCRAAYFNPRGPCGPRRREAPHGGGHAGISILAVLADRDRYQILHL